MKEVLAGSVAMVCLVVLFASPWIVNAWKLSDCDFESNYRCEIIHGVGRVVPPLSIVTVWFDDDVVED